MPGDPLLLHCGSQTYHKPVRVCVRENNTTLLLMESYNVLHVCNNKLCIHKMGEGGGGITLSRACIKPASPLNALATMALYLLWTSSRACTYILGS